MKLYQNFITLFLLHLQYKTLGGLKIYVVCIHSQKKHLQHIFSKKEKTLSERAVGLPSAQKQNQFSINSSSEIEGLLIQEYKLSCTQMLNNFLPENRSDLEKCCMTLSLQRIACPNLWTGWFIQKQQFGFPALLESP